MNQPTKNEVILLLSVWRLEDEAYGVKIREQIKQTTKMDWNYGTLYCTLDQLVRKGHLYKTEGQPVAERGGRRKIFYQLTADGIEVLQKSMELQRVLWKGVTHVALGGGK